MASALFLVLLGSVVLSAIMVSVRGRPLLLLVRGRRGVDDTTVLLGVLLIFDMLAVGLLLRFDTG